MFHVVKRPGELEDVEESLHGHHVTAGTVLRIDRYTPFSTDILHVVQLNLVPQVIRLFFTSFQLGWLSRDGDSNAVICGNSQKSLARLLQQKTKEPYNNITHVYLCLKPYKLNLKCIVVDLRNMRYRYKRFCASARASPAPSFFRIAPRATITIFFLHAYRPSGPWDWVHPPLS